ncbi:MAG TPA: hypothetical protein VFZ65_16620 [Planctomycetota bacterium]|nr:hypothetical protein [Planctomycetota bacterium]
MRYLPLLSLLALGTQALAQNWYVPDNDATMGTINVIPFGSTGTGSFYNCRMQVRATAAELGGLPNLITGLGFAAGGTGRAHYTTLDIVMDHIPAAQALSTTFASNLTVNAVPVLSAANYTWNVTANTWNEVGLQIPFVFNGVDDVIIDITTTEGTAPSGMRRGTNQRIYATSASGPTGPTGTSSASATKFEISMLTARVSSYGDGCPGSNGTPLLGFSGSAQVGNTVAFNLSNGVQNGLALLLAGTTNAFPFPFELTPLSAPGCYAYTDLAFTSIVLLDPAGAGTVPLPIPPALVGFLFYTQYACLDLAANPFGFTTSNYGRVLTGN